MTDRTPDVTCSDGVYRCYGRNCDEEFNTLDDMKPVVGKDGRDVRHFCQSCAEGILQDRYDDTDT